MLFFAVSIHAPTRGATYFVSSSPARKLFQSTRPRGARPMRATNLITVGCFNPRAHAGRDIHLQQDVGLLAVSIHAPTRGATHGHQTLGRYRIVSIHAPTRGATYVVAPPSVVNGVSIHAPTRGATSVRTRSSSNLRVSIHAPTRGATCPGFATRFPLRFQSTRPRGARHFLSLDILAIGCFNPRAHAGRDIARVAICARIVLFQSTRPRGARLVDCADINTWAQFQSTRPRGARQKRRGATTSPYRFQSTRPRGARHQSVVGRSTRLPVSIHAPTRGATRADGGARLPSQVSIHAPTRGATSSFSAIPLAQLMFQSTRPRGARLVCGAKEAKDKGFNPRAHAGRDATSP